MQIEQFFSPNSCEDQKKKKKKVFSRNRTLFSPNLRSALHPFKSLGDATIGGDTAKDTWRSLPGFGTPVCGFQNGQLLTSQRRGYAKYPCILCY